MRCRYGLVVEHHRHRGGRNFYLSALHTLIYLIYVNKSRVFEVRDDACHFC